MATIVHHGKARNLTNSKVGETLVPDSAERQFVTFVNDLGGVHTIIADAETAFTDAEQFLTFFEHTRALSHVSASEGQAGHTPPAEIVAKASDAAGVKAPEQQQSGEPGVQQSTTGGEF